MKYTKGLVSVIMPTYKRSEQLDRAILSVLNQTYENIELLLVNDNEPDDEYSHELERRVYKYLSSTKFKYIKQEKHINGAAARNVGIKNAKGEYIAFLDDDDWWHLDKIEKQVEVLNKLDTEWGVVSCMIERYQNEHLVAKLPSYQDGYVYKDILMLKSDFATGTLMFRHEALDNTGYFDEKLFRHQDLQILIQFTYKYKLYQIKEYLHCCDIGDAQNRLDGERLYIQKKELFESVSNVMCSLKKVERKAVYCINYFELGYAYLKSKNYKKAFCNIIKVFGSFKALGVAFHRVYSKLISNRV